MPKSHALKINTTELLRIIKGSRVRLHPAPVAEKLNVIRLTAGNQIKILRQMGLVEIG